MTVKKILVGVGVLLVVASFVYFFSNVWVDIQELKRDLATAQAAVIVAQTSVDNAQISANEAKTMAVVAQTSADNAQISANEGKAMANEAQVSANTAQATADAAMAAIVAEAEAQATASSNHIVIAGDTIWDIWESLGGETETGMNWAQFRAATAVANELADPGLILVGQVLVIPAMP